MKKLSTVIILSIGALSYSTVLLATSSPAFHQCTKAFTYDIYLSQHKIGHLTRTLKWQDNNLEVYSYSKIKMLVAKSKLRQQSRVYWSEQQNSFLTQSFSRKITGLMAGTISATFSSDGRRSSINNNGSTATFSSHDLPIMDGDAVGSQIRHNLIEGKTAFNFKLQDSNDVDHYYFEVKRKEKINTRFGKLQTFRVEQVRKNDRKLVMWFAPEIDYQLVKATYKRKILDLKAVLKNSDIQCPTQFAQLN
ncbi:DUF3108 domain-containing protein [uncultured Photobacterium sp.]|uniref:DUF3108 domain-containing protein n=1 Tax=uncultured Photobacterium sp. TaxID=173973 RepID=UPI0026159DCD|nr:DUF3108 domain-containing protein [uncultured Photobacterium sp.]